MMKSKIRKEVSIEVPPDANVLGRVESPFTGRGVFFIPATRRFPNDMKDAKGPFLYGIDGWVTPIRLFINLHIAQ